MTARGLLDAIRIDDTTNEGRIMKATAKKPARPNYRARYDAMLVTCASDARTKAPVLAFD